MCWQVRGLPHIMRTAEEIRKQGFLDLASYGATTNAQEALAFFKKSEFLVLNRLCETADLLSFSDGRLNFTHVPINSYFASATVDFLRQKLLERRISFTFETVMSHPSKVDLLRHAQTAGYRTYLYFIATDDPEINISRVRNRVKLGGHDVPEDRIASRYYRSLDLLLDAIRHTNRAYVFDNSSDNRDR